MRVKRHKTLIQKLLSEADVLVDGDRPWDIHVRNDALYQRILAKGTLGLGEAYVDGWWECNALDEFFNRVIRADLGSSIRLNFRTIVSVLSARLFNLQSQPRAFMVGERHYDVGNDLYREMLDRRMIYSCGYWKDARDLDEAQEAKLELVCKKIELSPGLKVLDIGCGWGGFAIYAAERYGVKVVGLTVSREQFHLAGELCKGLPIEIRFQDYRDIQEEFDRIVCIGMIEHVGYKNYGTFMKVLSKCLRMDGVCLLQTICNNVSTYSIDPWMEKYIFPNSMIPSLAQLSKAAEGLFVIEDIHKIGPDYDQTCVAWNRNFQRAWPLLQDLYGERFRRMWQYYLLSAAGNFRARYLQVLQIVMTQIGRAQPDCRKIYR